MKYFSLSTVFSEDGCLSLCKYHDDCTDFTFYSDDSICHLFIGCEEIYDDYCSDCVSGSVQDCDPCERDGNMI